MKNVKYYMRIEWEFWSFENLSFLGSEPYKIGKLTLASGSFPQTNSEYDKKNKKLMDMRN